MVITFGLLFFIYFITCIGIYCTGQTFSLSQRICKHEDFLHFFMPLPMRNQMPLTCSLGDWSFFHGLCKTKFVMFTD